MRMTVRIGYNELQQAETDTFIGYHIELLNENQRELAQTGRGMATLEEYIQCVPHGLVHHGGLICFEEMTALQSDKRRTHKCSNLATLPKSARYN